MTGSQARRACSLLKWTRYEVIRRIALPLWIVDLILAGQNDLDVTPEESAILRDAFDLAGVDFALDDDGGQIARLRTSSQDERAIWYRSSRI